VRAGFGAHRVVPLDWTAANVAAAQVPAGNLEPAKEKSPERIDGIVALIMAIGRAMIAQEEPQPAYSLNGSDAPPRRPRLDGAVGDEAHNLPGESAADRPRRTAPF
jgi:hypothetical protein